MLIGLAICLSQRGTARQLMVPNSPCLSLDELDTSKGQDKQTLFGKARDRSGIGQSKQLVKKKKDDLDKGKYNME